MIKLLGTKIVEIPYFSNQLTDQSKSILIIGECQGVEGISETVYEKGFNNTFTTDIMPSDPNSWLRKNVKWPHIQIDFVEFDECNKYDYIISISVFEHFGFWFAGNRMAYGLVKDDICYWNHDIKGINKACKLLKDENSKLIITLPAGPYMNYEKNGEPFLRYYNYQRQTLIKEECENHGYKITDEKFYYSENFTDWYEVGLEINDTKYYKFYNPFSPNVIWGFTIKKQ